MKIRVTQTVFTMCRSPLMKAKHSSVSELKGSIPLVIRLMKKSKKIFHLKIFKQFNLIQMRIIWQPIARHRRVKWGTGNLVL